ncbi:MAG: DUF58 domain-containing protein [Colwellia sp.]
MWFSKNKPSAVNKLKTASLGAQYYVEQLKNIDSNGLQLSMTELVNYQSKTFLIDLSAKKNIHGQMSGNYLARSKGSGMEFDEVRHYQTGDDIRAIDWRVTARTGKTHTKLFREEVERPVLVATDIGKNMHFGSKLLFKSVQASHLASLVAWHAKSRGDRLGGIIFNEHEHVELKPRSRKEGVLHYLHALKRVHNNSYDSLSNPTNQAKEKPFEEKQRAQIHLEQNYPEQSYLEQNCARLRQLAKPGSLVYLITDGINIDTDNTLRHLTHISRHCELVVCLVTDPLEQQLPDSNVKINVAITDGSNDQQLTLGDKKTAQNYHQKALNLQQTRHQSLIETGARVINISAGNTLASQLKKGEV